MRIFISGGAGFIGSHLCKKLLHEKHTVICVDNFITGDKRNVAELSKNKNFTLIEHDITKPLQIDGSLDWVFHFASPASPKDYLQYPIKTLKVGTLGTHICLGIAKSKKAKFFMASTSEVYGDPSVSPQPEEYWGNVNPVGPRSCYDEAKRAAEALTFAYNRQHNVNTRLIRIFNTYGPFMRLDDGRVVSNFIHQALTGQDITIYGDGAQTRSFCYVDDLVRGIIKYMDVDYSGPLNLGAPFEFTIRELAEKVIALTDSKSHLVSMPLPQDDPKQRRPDISKAVKLLGWEPVVSLEEGLKYTIAYFKQRLSA
ncbi:MAG: SDR family oxidoreductase [Candidatus Omnitrophica bacterium]|nr:SDR family oxidoreductase [Candidatus Omnitrophota bacterium]